MIRLFANADYDFISYRWKAIWITALLVVPGLIFMLVKGMNYSIEFTGGTLVHIEAAEPLDIAVLRGGLEDAGIGGAEITQFGSDREYVIRARITREGIDPNNTEATAAAVNEALIAALGDRTFRTVRTAAVSPKVGAELRQKAFMAIFLSFFAVLAYLAIRFEWRFGLAAVIATAHDILATIVFVAVMQLEVSLVVVAALLSMVGYSLNDTIIIFDRVRENLHKMKRESFITILNRSINETLPRSILTHGCALASLLALAVFGGEVIRPFSLVMFFGVFTGTFSSIYIASPVLMWIEQRWPGADVHGTRKSKSSSSRPARRKTQPVA